MGMVFSCPPSASGTLKTGGHGKTVPTLHGSMLSRCARTTKKETVMHESIPLDIAAIMGIGILGIVILDMILLGSWTAPYYRHGIPIFSKTVQFYAITSTAISDLLSGEFPRGFGPSQLFHPISENEVAFREQAFGFNNLGFGYSPVMHGLITISPLGRTVVIKGFLNWYIIWYIIEIGISSIRMAIGSAPAHFALIFGAGFCLVFIPIYFIQARTYKRIVEILRHKGQEANA